MKGLSITLAALYLRGGPRAVELRRGAWPEVLRVLRRSGGEPEDAAEALRQAGQWAEALVLEDGALADWAALWVSEGRVLSAADSDYPCRWLRVLGAAAPPALWKTGHPPSLPCVSIVGSRAPSGAVTRFCHGAGREAARLGFAVVSGRAEGCDRAAASGALSVGPSLLEILPYGINRSQPRDGECLVSVCAPDEPFSAGAAMERNALIYAASSHTVIGQGRYREGGTWTGAVHAIRARLSTLVVRRTPEIAMRSLVALGGVWIDTPSDLAQVLKAGSVQGELLGLGAD